MNPEKIHKLRLLRCAIEHTKDAAPQTPQRAPQSVKSFEVLRIPLLPSGVFKNRGAENKFQEMFAGERSVATGLHTGLRKLYTPRPFFENGCSIKLTEERPLKYGVTREVKQGCFFLQKQKEGREGLLWEGV